MFFVGFLAVDPLAPEYPWYTPYQFAGNSPIANIDVDGLEPIESITNKENGALYIIKSDWVTVTPPSRWDYMQGALGRNRYSGWESQGCGCGLSSNVPTNGATGYAGGVANSALAPIAAVSAGVLFAGAAATVSLSNFAAFANTAGAAFSSTARAGASQLAKNYVQGGVQRFAVDFAFQSTINGVQGKNIVGNYNLTAGLVATFSPLGRVSTFQRQVLLGGATGGLGSGFSWTPNDIIALDTPSFSMEKAVFGTAMGGMFSGVGGLWSDIPIFDKPFKAFGTTFSKHPLGTVGEVGMEGLSVSFGTVVGEAVDTKINTDEKNKN